MSCDSSALHACMCLWRCDVTPCHASINRLCTLCLLTEARGIKCRYSRPIYKRTMQRKGSDFQTTNLSIFNQSIDQSIRESLQCPESEAEYGAGIWDPHLKKDILALEKVQNRAVCWVCDIGPKDIVSMTKLKKDLNWPTLERRSRDQCLILMFKVVNGLVMITPIDLGLIEWWENPAQTSA